MSAGIEMALPLMPGSLLRASQASSHALALRDEMKTLEHPAWRRLYACDSVRQSNNHSVTHGYPPRCSVETETSRSASHDSHLLVEGEDGREVLKLDICFGRHFELVL